jgi:hypothetical protein
MTAEEFLQYHLEISYFYDDKTEKVVCYSDEVEQAMVEFAKLHVTEALKAANEKVILNSVEYAKYRGTIIKTENLGQEVSTENPQVYIQADSNSILTAYPLDLIK